MGSRVALWPGKGRKSQSHEVTFLFYILYLYIWIHTSSNLEDLCHLLSMCIGIVDAVARVKGQDLAFANLSFNCRHDHLPNM